MPSYTTISGHSLDYPEPEPELAKLLTRLRKMVDDPKATENNMIELAYSRENPILGAGLHPSRGMVTRETLANPVYHVITDLLDRKRAALEGWNLDELASEYTLTPAEAAAKLGVHYSAVQQAIKAWRLPSWVKDGRYYLTERSLETFEVGKRGPRAADAGEPLDVCVGHTDGQSFRMKHPGDLENIARIEGHVVAGRVARWKRVGVISGTEGKHRFFVLEPGTEGNELKFGPFYVKGTFRIAEKVNAAEKAREAWKAFTAA